MKRKKLLSMALFCGVLSISSALALAVTTAATDTSDSKEKELITEVVVSTSYEVSAATSESEYTYEIDTDTGNAVITGYTGTETELVIPSVIDGYKVVKIGEYAFAYEAISAVVLPSTITEIEEKAFYKCDTLKTFKFNEGTEGIVIGEYALAETAISAVVLPSTVTEIEEGAFYECESLKTVEFNEGIKDAIIGEAAFFRTSIETITIPGNYKEIGKDAFCVCDDLKSVVYEASKSGVADQKILDGAFSTCTELESITLTSSMLEIHEDAFFCAFSVSFYGDVGEYVENYAKEHDIDCVTGSGVTESGYSYNISFGNAVITGYTGKEVKVTIPSEVDGYKVIKIAAEAFRFNRIIEYLTISEGIEVIGRGAFYGSNVEYLYLPSTIRKIGDDAFGGCVEEVTFKKGESDAIIGDGAFYCAKITSITIPANYAVIGDGAFGDCDNLTTVIFESDGVEREGQYIGISAFNDCSALEIVVMPSTIKNIARSSYYMPVFYNSSLVTIYGHEGSAAQAYADECSIPFVAYENTAVLKSDMSPITAIGDIVTLDASESTGYGKLKYQYLMHNKDTSEWKILIDYLSASKYTWLSNQLGNVEFFVKVKDETGFVTTSKAVATNIKSELAELKFTATTDKSWYFVGEKVKVNVDVTSGEAPYTYSYTVHNLEIDGWYSYKSGEFVDVNYYKWDAPSAGTREFYVKVKDASGRVVTSEPITIEVYDKITGKLSVNNKTTAVASTEYLVGDKVLLKAESVTGGSGDYTYKFAMHDVANNKWILLKDYSSESTFTYNLETTGDKMFYVDVKDSVGNIKRFSVDGITVVEALTATAKVDKTKVTVGEKVKITIVATGGYESYTYTYKVYNETTKKWSTLKSDSTSSEYIWTAKSAGTRVFYVEVTDSNGNTVRSEGVTVTTTPKLSVSATVSTKTSVVGDKVKFTVAATGGSGSYKYSYIVYNKTTGKWARLKDEVLSNTYTWTAKSAGTRVFYVDVTDANGKTVRSEGVTIETAPKLSVTVSASDTTPANGDKITIKATATGGIGNYTYSFLVYNVTTKKWNRFNDGEFIESNTKTWKVPGTGKRKFFVEVKDATGKVVRSEGITISVK